MSSAIAASRPRPTSTGRPQARPMPRSRSLKARAGAGCAEQFHRCSYPHLLGDGLIHFVKVADVLELAEHLAVVADEQQRRAVFAARFADQRERFARVLLIEISRRFIGVN